MRRNSVIFSIVLGLMLWRAASVNAVECGGELFDGQNGGVVCVQKECHVFEYAKAELNCAQQTQTYNGYCSGACTAGENCDFSAYSCNFCGSCGEEKWCGACGGGGGLSIPEKPVLSNVWIRVLERGADGRVIAYKGNQANDAVWTPSFYDNWTEVREKSLEPRFSVDPELGGGMKNGEYMKYWTTYNQATDSAVWKTWDTGHNVVDGSMNLEVNHLMAPTDNLNNTNTQVEAREYWSNHFCTGGVAQNMSDGQWPDYSQAEKEGYICPVWEESCDGDNCSRWCKGDVDGCWSNWQKVGDSQDNFGQLNAIRNFAIAQEDTQWMDLRYDGLWSLSYAALTSTKDNQPNEIKLIPPQGKVCKSVRWFTGAPSEQQTEKGKMEFVRNDQGVCSVNNFSYNSKGNLLIFEVESAEEAPTLESNSKCSSDGKQMTLAFKTALTTARVQLMGNRGGSSDPWTPGNNRVGPQDFMISDLVVSSENINIISTAVDPNTEYAFSFMPCAKGEQFPCSGKALSFTASCPVTEDPEWKITARAMCQNGEKGSVINPSFYPNSETKYSVTKIDNTGDQLVASDSGNMWRYNLDVKGKQDVDYVLKFGETGKNESLNLLGVEKLGEARKLTATSGFNWNSKSMTSGSYIVDFEAPRNWCVPKTTWNLVPKINCGGSKVPYVRADISYEMGQEKMSHVFSSCPRYMIVNSRGYDAIVTGVINFGGKNYSLAPKQLIACDDLASCFDSKQIVTDNYSIQGNTLEINNNLPANNYLVQFDIPEEIVDKVCGPQITLGQCKPIYPYLQVLDSD